MIQDDVTIDERAKNTEGRGEGSQVKIESIRAEGVSLTTLKNGWKICKKKSNTVGHQRPGFLYPWYPINAFAEVRENLGDLGKVLATLEGNVRTATERETTLGESKKRRPGIFVKRSPRFS